MRMNDLDLPIHTSAALKGRFLKRFAFMLIPCALIAIAAWVLGRSGPLGPFLPIYVFAVAAILSAWNCVEVYRKERKST